MKIETSPGIGRFAILVVIGIVAAYLMGPLSPIPGANVWGIALLITMPLATLAFAIFGTVLRRDG